MNYRHIPKWQLIAVPAVVIILGVYYFSRYYVADELIYANKRVKTLQQDLQTAIDQLETEKARSTMAKHEADVVRRANALLRASERDRQDEIAALKADLSFYRRLGGANGSQAPLAVQFLELEATQSPRVYRLLLTLTQNLRWVAVISGNVQLSVDGIQNDVAQHLTNEQLLAESSAPLTFQFKHFQQLESLITLPEGFEASRLNVQLKSGSLRTPVEHSMEWQSLFNKTTTDTGAIEIPVITPDN